MRKWSVKVMFIDSEWRDRGSARGLFLKVSWILTKLEFLEVVFGSKKIFPNHKINQHLWSLLMVNLLEVQRVKVPARPVSHVMSERLHSYFSNFFKLKSSYSFMLTLANFFLFLAQFFSLVAYFEISWWYSAEFVTYCYFSLPDRPG